MYWVAAVVELEDIEVAADTFDAGADAFNTGADAAGTDPPFAAAIDMVRLGYVKDAWLTAGAEYFSTQL